MVGPQQAIRFAAASAKVHRKSVPTATIERPHHATHVGTVGRALQAVSDQHSAIAKTVRPIHVEKVSIRELESPANVPNLGNATTNDGKDCLRMPVLQPPRSAIAGGNNRHSGRGSIPPWPRSRSAAAKEKAPFQAPFGLVGKGGYLVAASLTDRRDFLRLALDLWMTPDFAALSNAELSLR